MGAHELHIHCIGLNHQTASVTLREQLAFTPTRLEISLARLGCGNGGGFNQIRELVILSTCNRVEIYALTADPGFDSLEAFLSETQNIPIRDFSPQIYRLSDELAVKHLLKVAAGLDSVVIGEPQILGQVADAYSSARRHGTTGKILSRLFQSAIHAGKRARTETSISHNPASISSVAVSLISEKVHQLGEAKIMVLGAGEMAELAVEALRKRGAGQITVVNRTKQRAQELAQRWDGQAEALEKLIELLPETDIVITSTGAPHTIIQASMVKKAISQMYDMDTLADHLEYSIARREAEIPQVNEILAQELASFMEYVTTLNVVPIIVEMRKQADVIRQAELEKTIRRIPDLPEDTQERIDALTKSIVNKILHSPTARLREEANGPNAVDYADIARGLFGLD